jgi:hypothetical protein
MDPLLVDRFNRHYDAAVYETVCREMERRCRESAFGFRLAELPLILPRDLRERCRQAAVEILAEIARPEIREAGEAAIPDVFRVPRTDALPHFLAIDLAIVRGPEGALEPRLVELQAFSSLYGMELVQGEIWGEVLASIPGMPARWTALFDGLDREGYLDLLRRTVIADEDPEQVVLLELDPESQKTRADFHVIEDELGVRSVCATEVRKEGRRLLAPSRRGWVPVRRIFNRIVFDELARTRVALPWSWHDDLDVSWVAHPNWYWIWSKHTLPKIRLPWVPSTRYLSEVDRLPENLDRYVLKPLFSFAGSGVVVDVTPGAIEAIPPAERGDWILQEKVDYAPALTAPDGAGVKGEIRMMFLRAEGSSDLRLAINLARLSRGKMHGVDHNRGLAWVGSSIAVWPVE